MEVVEKHPTV